MFEIIWLREDIVLSSIAVLTSLFTLTINILEEECAKGSVFYGKTEQKKQGTAPGENMKHGTTGRKRNDEPT